MIREALVEARAELASLRGREAELERQITEAERALGEEAADESDEGESITLHEAIAEILRSTGNEGMSGRELADAINRRSLYRRRDGMPVEANQVNARVNNYRDMFEKTPAGIRLRVSEDWSSAPVESVTIFKDDDAGFHAWLDAHPDGYFINTERKPRKSYLVLHQPACPHFDRSPKVHWTKDYIKVCGTDRHELEGWANDNVGGEVTLCSKCFG